MDPDALRRQLGWLTSLHWFAAALLVVGPTAASELLRLEVALLPLQAAGLALGLANLGARAWLRRLDVAGDGHGLRSLVIVADCQLALDLVVLAAVIHVTGGPRSPLPLFALFPVAFAGMTLPRGHAYGSATLAWALYAMVVAGESGGWLSHYGALPGASDRYADQWAALASLTAAVYLTAYATELWSQQHRRRQAEMASLAEDLARQARSCHVAYAELQTVQEAQLEYMQRLAHELKSPLSAINMMLQAAADSLRGSIPDKQAELLRRAAQRAQAALQLTDDLLTLSEVREAASSAPPTKISLSHLIDSILEEEQYVGEQHRVSLVADVEDGLRPVLGYRPELIALLRNLISNAVKYSPPGGQVTIRARSGPQDVVLEVRDQGMGIAAEEVPRLFEEFYRTPAARASGTSGTGLGLAIVKSIVDHHNGSVAVESKPGEGTTFRVRLPAPDPAPTWGTPGPRHPGRETE